ncbi:MAG: hypothetical protein J5787_08685 [Alphaproteobacteria bacterium]|nr:hypothetical protein [Alphaproteobacteria bacterium]MBO4644829.1 hypothetical protein [Alphaproteobacteria bacterium]
MVQNELLENSDLDDLESLSVSDEKIETRRLRPLASFFDFDVSIRPTQAKDRISRRNIYIGILLGIALIALGFLSDFGAVDDSLFAKDALLSADTVVSSSFSAAWLFVALGLFLIITRVLLLFYGRDYFIGHKFAAVVIQKPFEHSKRIADSLNEYIGVRYRTRIVNVLGLTSFTQHIIDLQHPNETKTIPLYITKNGENISQKWEDLARQLQKPAVFNTADGIIEIEPQDIQKSLPDLISEGKVAISDQNLYKIPRSFKIVEDAESCQIDPQIRDSAFSLFSGIMCFSAFFCILFFSFIFHLPLSYIPLLFVGLILFVVIPLALFLRRKRVIISSQGIRIKSKWLFFPSIGFLIRPKELEYIYVFQSSYDLKYTLVIGADGLTAHIGRGLSKEDLEWLRNFINAQIKHFMCH